MSVLSGTHEWIHSDRTGAKDGSVGQRSNQ